MPSVPFLCPQFSPQKYVSNVPVVIWPLAVPSEFGSVLKKKMQSVNLYGREYSHYLLFQRFLLSLSPVQPPPPPICQADARGGGRFPLLRRNIPSNLTSDTASLLVQGGRMSV